jgi:hypothetical protein
MAEPAHATPWVLAMLAVLAASCGESGTHPATAPPPLRLRAVTFNVGTSPGLVHDGGPDDGYTSVQAAISDMWYGDGLAWLAVIEDTRRFFAAVAPDVVTFQEIFYSGNCPDIPAEFRIGWACETWRPGDPTVAQVIVGSGYQVACNLGKPDKCAAVKRTFGRFRGCTAALCLDGLDGARVEGCGGGSRVGRGIIELATGGRLTLVNVHGTSGLSPGDMDCRIKQFAQVFTDLGRGDGEPAANGERNLVMGDLNTDPLLASTVDRSAMAFLEYVGPGRRFDFVSSVGPDAPPSYAGRFNIDHVVSDVLTGACWVAGVTDGHPPVTNITYFDHKPVVCDLWTR